MEIQVVGPTANVVANTGLRFCITVVVQKTQIFGANFQKRLLSEYKWNSKNKPQEYNKFLANKKAYIIIIFKQCDKATKTKIVLGATYAADNQAGNLIEFPKRLCTVFPAVMMVAYYMDPINKL